MTWVLGEWIGYPQSEEVYDAPEEREGDCGN